MNFFEFENRKNVDNKNPGRILKTFNPERTTPVEIGNKKIELPNYSGVKKYADERGILGVALSQATGNVAGVNFGNLEAAIPWNAVAIDNADVTISGSEITIGRAGLYKFTVYLRTDSNNRTELFIKTYINVGAGLVQDTNAIVSDYVARDLDQNTGGVTLVYSFELNAGDIVEFRGEGDCDGTCVGVDEGTVVMIEEYT